MITLADLTTAQLLHMRATGAINGCGPQTWKRKIPTPHCTADCEEHDLRYWVGGTEDDRKAADYALYDAIRRDARRLWWGQRILALIDAWLFYRAVRRYGAAHFHHGAPRTVPAVAA